MEQCFHDFSEKELYYNFLITILQRTSRKSRGVALIPLKNKILYSYSREIEKDIYTSPIYEVILEYTKILGNTEKNISIYCSCFPNLEELIFICNTNINIIYYIGEIEDIRVGNLLNQTNLKIIKLETNK